MRTVICNLFFLKKMEEAEFSNQNALCVCVCVCVCVSLFNFWTSNSFSTKLGMNVISVLDIRPLYSVISHSL